MGAYHPKDSIPESKSVQNPTGLTQQDVEDIGEDITNYARGLGYSEEDAARTGQLARSVLQNGDATSDSKDLMGGER